VHTFEQPEITRLPTQDGERTCKNSDQLQRLKRVIRLTYVKAALTQKNDSTKSKANIEPLQKNKTYLFMMAKSSPVFACRKSQRIAAL